MKQKNTSVPASIAPYILACLVGAVAGLTYIAVVCAALSA